MKVVLLQDVAKIGRKHEIVEVPSGYARNKLIPQRLAEEATAGNQKRVEARAKQANEQHAAEGARFDEALQNLEGKEITIAANANDKGHLFEALKSDRIAAARKDAGVSIAPSAIEVVSPIKETGTHMIVLASGDKRKELTITVMKA